MRVTSEVLESVARDGITEAECRIAKGSLRGGIVLGLEDSSSRMSRIGRSELNYGKHRSIEHTLRQIDEVTVDEVNAVAQPAADQALRRRRSGAVCFETITAATTSGDGKLAGWYWAFGTSRCPSWAHRWRADPARPALAAAVSNAGGLGFVPAGYLSADQFAGRHRGGPRRHHRPARRQPARTPTQRRRLGSTGLLRGRTRGRRRALPGPGRPARITATTTTGRASSRWWPTCARSWCPSPSECRRPM